jgi:photosystem II stability/assembly factor-like uncharacterized protein
VAIALQVYKADEMITIFRFNRWRSSLWVLLLNGMFVLLSLNSAEAQVRSLVDAVSADSLLARLRELTGAVPVMIGGQQRTIYTRTVLTTGNRLAAQYLEEQFKRFGLSVQRQYFHGKYNRFPLNFTDLAQSGRTLWMSSDWGEVFRSDDTARTWISYKQSGTPQLDPKASSTPPDTSDRLDWICVADTSSLFAIGKTGIQTVTIDGGKTWHSHQTGFTKLVHAFNQGKTILAVSQNGLVWRSTNFGTDWAKVSIDTATAFFNQGAFVTSSRAYIVGSDQGANSGRLYVTTDAGLTWNLVSLPGSKPLLSLSATDSLHLWIASSRGNVLSTSSGGTSWTNASDGDTSAGANRIFFSDTLNGWISASDRNLYRTTNGGTSWTLASTFDSTMQIRDFIFLSPSRGILIGKEFSGFSTTDGGTTWQDNTVPLLSNVLATLPGSKYPSRYILIAAHYDLEVAAPDNRFLEGHGADDDGSGTVALLELARVFLQFRIPVTLRFAAIPDEEWFDIGSGALGTILRAQNDTVLGGIDLDMVGYDDLHPDTVAIGYLKDTVLSNRFLKAVSDFQLGLTSVQTPNAIGANLDALLMYGKPPPILSILDGAGLRTQLNHNMHTLKDTWSTLNPSYYRNIVRATAAVIYDFGGGGTVENPPPKTTPLNFSLMQNYPNPFNPSTTIRFDVAQPGVVKLKVFNVLGQLLTTLVDEQKNAGSYVVEWSAAGVASGVYFYRLETGNFVQTKKMIFVR